MLTAGSSLSGRYKVDKRLGQGGMGAVYLARLESLGNKPVAIKEMELAVADARTAESAARQFQREATFLAHLDHPNLVRVTDFFQEKGKYYLVMEYVKGETLQDRLQKLQQPLEWGELQPYALSLVDVLEYLHTQDPPILFRDLKPANIMLEASGRMKLIDFGIARTAQPGTQTSTFLKGTGTNGFSPIEQYGNGETTDQRSDIYALGATIYYLSTGRIPPEAVLRVSSGKELAVPTRLNPLLPTELDGFLGKCLAVRQADRYSSMSEVREALLAIPAGVPSEKESLPAGSGTSVLTTTPVPAPRGAITVEMFPSHSKKDSSSKTTLGLAVGALMAAVTLTVVTLGLKSGDGLKQTVVESGSATETRQAAIPAAATSPAPEPPAEQVAERDIPKPTYTRTAVPRETAAPENVETRPAPISVDPVAKVSAETAPSLGTAPSYPKAAPKPKTVQPAASVAVRPAEPPSYPRAAPPAFPAPPPDMAGHPPYPRPGERVAEVLRRQERRPLRRGR